ncbi:MAG: gamma-glutamyl-gamma-aminobutyrate hydrolase family protein [Caldilineaceae bacterium]
MNEEQNAKPIIGVTTKRGNPRWVRDNTQTYLDALAAHGAIGVVLAPDTPAALPDGTTFTPDELGRLPGEILDNLDGLVLAGGGDVHPQYFGATLNGANPDSIDHLRDELELNLARRALHMDLPLFGICRGCQVLNVAAGGGMVQHFDNHRSSAENPFQHDVIIDAASRLYQIVGADRLTTNTYHHQGIDQATLAPILRPAGIAEPDPWLLEAFESADHTWVIGVQWHPERFLRAAGHAWPARVDFKKRVRIMAHPRWQCRGISAKLPAQVV